MDEYRQFQAKNPSAALKKKTCHNKFAKPIMIEKY